MRSGCGTRGDQLAAIFCVRSYRRAHDARARRDLSARSRIERVGDQDSYLPPEAAGDRLEFGAAPTDERESHLASSEVVRNQLTGESGGAENDQIKFALNHDQFSSNGVAFPALYYEVVSPFVERLHSRLRAGSAARQQVNEWRRLAAVAALVHDGAGGPRVLLMKRVERVGDPWSGHISLPGGRYESGDETLLTTAIRETREELGVDLAPTQLIGPLPAIAPFASGPSGMEVTPFVFSTTCHVEPMCGPEAVSAFWLPIESVATGELDSTYIYPGTTRAFPSWSFGGHIIWGLTWRIVSELIAMGLPADSRGTGSAMRS